jgi:predicted secreted protein
MRTLILSLFLVLSSWVWAGDTAQLNFIGFSKDGKHLSFQQHGVRDGKGTAYAETFFIDVLTNKYTDKVIATETDDEGRSEEDVSQSNLSQAWTKLKELKIETGNQGKNVASDSYKQGVSEPKEVKFTLSDGKNAGDYTLKLQEQKGNADCAGLTETKMFTLSLQNEKDKKPKILQQDKSIPKTRGCAIGYRIQDVYVYEGQYLVVFLNVLMPGFEGGNMRYVAVTGSL